MYLNYAGACTQQCLFPMSPCSLTFGDKKKHVARVQHCLNQYNLHNKECTETAVIRFFLPQ